MTTKKDFNDVWELAVPYLKKGKRKDFLIHTRYVVKAMKMLLKKEAGDPDIMIPAAMLHDTGWSNVPLELQKHLKGEKARRALELHLEYAVPIIEEVLTKLDYDKGRIQRITEVVLSHKFKDPKELEKRLLIDADTLSDAFKEPFYEDCKAYNMKPKKLYEFRKKNKFYTKSAREIFRKELGKRKKEIMS